MATRTILEYKEDCMKKISRPVENFDEKLATLIDDMLETMYQADGAGLAAVQVGVLRRVVVIDVGDGPIELVNPEIVSVSGEQCDYEGCLSVPGLNGKVTRPDIVTIKGMDRHGKEHVYTGQGLLARAFCHETDHLDGKIFLDLVEGELVEV